MGMYGKGMGKCKTYEHPIEDHCSDDHWCPKCGEVGHHIEINSHYNKYKFID